MRPVAKVVATCSVAAAIDSMDDSPCLPRADGGSFSGLSPVNGRSSSLSELESPDFLSRFLPFTGFTGLCKGDPSFPKPLKDIQACTANKENKQARAGE